MPSHQQNSNAKRKIGIYPGSFNPIHNGHIALALYLTDKQIVDEVWVVVSPQNPLKSTDGLIDNDLRLQMACLAFEDSPKVVVLDVEFYLPRPSYTIDTLNFLQARHADYLFYLLIGEDNIATFDKWKNYDTILKRYSLLVYPRQSGSGVEQPKKILQYPNVEYIIAPNIDISSSEIRKRLKQNLSIKGLTPDTVIRFIEKNRLYI